MPTTISSLDTMSPASKAKSVKQILNEARGEGIQPSYSYLFELLPSLEKVAEIKIAEKRIADMFIEFYDKEGTVTLKFKY